MMLAENQMRTLSNGKGRLFTSLTNLLLVIVIGNVWKVIKFHKKKLPKDEN
jgi:hypothetical protein